MQRIYDARKANGMTQEQLAKAIGVNRSVISKYENGTIEPSVSQLDKIANALNVPLNSLLVDFPSAVVIAPTVRISFRKHFTDGSLVEINEETYESPDEAIKQSLLADFPQIVNRVLILESSDESVYRRGSQWIPIYQDGSISLVPADPELAQSYSNALRKKFEDELLSDKAGILQRANEGVEKSITELVSIVKGICKDDRAVSEAQQLHEAELMPGRIGVVTDFIKRNADFLKGNMPGMVPDPAEKK